MIFKCTLIPRRVVDLRRLTKPASRSTSATASRRTRAKTGAAAPTGAAPDSASDQIRSFLAGTSDGEALLRALYDHILDEPIPEKLRRPLRR